MQKIIQPAPRRSLVEVGPGKKIRDGSGTDPGYPSRIRLGNLFWAGTGTDIYVRRIGMYVGTLPTTYCATTTLRRGKIARQRPFYTWESVQTKIVLPVPAVPVPTSPEGVIPEVPVPGGFFCRDHLYSLCSQLPHHAHSYKQKY